jgi:hypothetical protein
MAVGEGKLHLLTKLFPLSSFPCIHIHWKLGDPARLNDMQPYPPESNECILKGIDYDVWLRKDCATLSLCCHQHFCYGELALTPRMLGDEKKLCV